MWLEYISSSWMKKELLLLTDLSFPQTWIQSSPLGCRQWIQHHQVTPETIQEVSDAPSRSKSIFRKTEKQFKFHHLHSSCLWMMHASIPAKCNQMNEHYGQGIGWFLILLILSSFDQCCSNTQSNECQRWAAPAITLPATRGWQKPHTNFSDLHKLGRVNFFTCLGPN